MKNRILFGIAIIVLALIVGYLVTYFFPTEVVNTKIEYRTRTITKNVYLDAIPIVRGVILPKDTITIPADTAELIARYKKLWYSYYTRNLYSDTLSFDTLGYAVINQQVIMNRLDSMNYYYKLFISEKTITNTVVKKHNFYMGSEIGISNFSVLGKYNNSNRYDIFLRYNFLEGTAHGGILININEIKRLW